jgi:hypothetical protein
MARAIGNGVLSFGLVSIPVEIHSAIQEQGIHMHLLHKKCGSRVRNQMICPVCKVVVERSDLRAKNSQAGHAKYSENSQLPCNKGRRTRLLRNLIVRIDRSFLPGRGLGRRKLSRR